MQDLIYTTLDGYKLHYEIHENVLPTTTLFIHGNMSSGRWWHPLLEVYQDNKASSNNGNMIIVNLRGFGNNATSNNQDFFTVPTFANDFLELVEANNWRNINLVGHSTGGIIAIEMLKRNPKQFNKLVLLNSVGVNGYKFRPENRALFQLMPISQNIVELAISTAIYGCDTTSSFFKNIILQDACKSIISSYYVFDNLDSFNNEVEIKNARIDNPVLILHGEKDQLLDIANSQKLSTLFTNNSFKLIANHGHSLNVENPKLFATLLNDFC